ncbi:MAG: flagellin FliC [Candidatus Latescibacteria bacterium]|nr:flagellin FliC [Candidatus Latescibacterota bacterium]
MPRINTNIPAITAQRHIGETEKVVNSSLRKVASGLRINRAADDPAGLTISEGLRAEINGLTQATRNADQGINMAQVAEGGLDQIGAALQRMRELSVQSASGTLNDQDRMALAQEFNQLRSEVDRIAGTTAYNGTQVLTGDTQTAQVGADNSSNNQVALNVGSANASALGVGTVSIADQGGAANAISTIDQAIRQVTAQRGTIGAFENRLGAAIASNQNAIENTQEAESSIRDTDIADAVTRLTAGRIRQQTGIAALTHANLSAERVRRLLG